MAKLHFFDTNVLVYAFGADARKRARAQDLIETALRTRQGVISSQVVQEFLNVATRKFARPMTNDDAVRYFDQVLEPLCVVWPDADLYRRALALRARFQFSFYDSLVVAAALVAGCTTLYSEDFQPGQRIDTLSIADPFGE